MTKSNFNEQLYFAYGSNINLQQMGYRCPGAEIFGPAVLEGYDLVFRGGSRRGSGVATVIPKEGSQVYGLLWQKRRVTKNPWIFTRDIPVCMKRKRLR